MVGHDGGIAAMYLNKALELLLLAEFHEAQGCHGTADGLRGKMLHYLRYADQWAGNIERQNNVPS